MYVCMCLVKFVCVFLHVALLFSICMHKHVDFASSYVPYCSCKFVESYVVVAVAIANVLHAIHVPNISKILMCFEFSY